MRKNSFLVACGLVVLTACQIASADAQAIWSNFQGSAGITQALDGTRGTVYWADAPSSSGVIELLILWNTNSGELVVYRDGTSVPDLVVSNANNHVYFEGDWVGSEAFMRGSLTTDINGYIVVEYQEEGFDGLRAVVDQEPTLPIAAATCTCYGTGTKRACANQECDTGECCTTGPGACSAYCQWRSAFIVSEYEPDLTYIELVE